MFWHTVALEIYKILAQNNLHLQGALRLENDTCFSPVISFLILNFVCKANIHSTKKLAILFGLCIMVKIKMGLMEFKNKLSQVLVR